MYTLFILFFASLIGITTMIGRKLAFVRQSELAHSEEVIHPFTPHLQQIKSLTRRGIRAYGYIILVMLVRLYVRLTALLKFGLHQTKVGIVTLYRKYRAKFHSHKDATGVIRESSSFLHRISEYKHKIREIKHKIHQEEKGL